MRFTGWLPLTVAVAVGLVACNANTSPAGPVDLSGTYTLQSIQVSGQTVANSSGTLQLTGATYDLALILNGQVQREDVGTYLVSGVNTWSQNSTTAGTTAIGTFTQAGTTLTITITFPTSTVYTWIKASQS
jgi:hypothetical protein